MPGGPDTAFRQQIIDSMQPPPPSAQDAGGANYLNQLGAIMASPTADYSSHGIAGVILGQLLGENDPEHYMTRQEPSPDSDRVPYNVPIQPKVMRPSPYINERMKRTGLYDIPTPTDPQTEIDLLKQLLLGHDSGHT